MFLPEGAGGGLYPIDSHLTLNLWVVLRHVKNDRKSSNLQLGGGRGEWEGWRGR